jgi:hypothetical protein
MLSPADLKTAEVDLSPLNTVSTEWTLLVDCARTTVDVERLNKSLRQSVNWPALLELAEAHGVLGLAATRLRDCSEAAVPPKIAQELRERHRAQVLLTLRLTAEMFRLFDCLAAAGLEALVIKGPVLSARCYGDPEVRHFGDLDLIARDKDILRFTERMIGLGYEPSVPLNAIHAKKAPGE